MGESVLVTSDEGGALHAFHNVCRHRGAELVPDPPPPRPVTNVARLLRCPYHAWSYALDGTPAASAVPRPGRPGRHPPCTAVAVDTWAGIVFVRLVAVGPRRSPTQWARPQLRSPAAARLDCHRAARTYDVAANWKVLAENYNECYHCGPVHPELCDLVAGVRHGGSDLGWADGIPHRDGAWTFTTTGTSDRAPVPRPRRRRAHPPQG